MARRYPILPLYMNIKNSDLTLKFYSVQYDAEKMKKFLENLIDKYSQIYREYGTSQDIAKLQYYHVMDSDFDNVSGKYKLAVKVVKKGVKRNPDLLHYRYTKYPLIYKIIKNILDSGSFDLEVFSEYYNQLKNTVDNRTMDLDFMKKITKIDKDEFYTDKYFLENKEKMILYTENEYNITFEEYQKIINNFFNLLKLKNYSINSITTEDYDVASRNAKNLDSKLIENTKLVKTLKKNNCCK